MTNQKNPNATPVRSLRIPSPLWEQVMAKAEAEGRSLADVTMGLYHRYLQTPPKPPAGKT